MTKKKGKETNIEFIHWPKEKDESKEKNVSKLTHFPTTYFSMVRKYSYCSLGNEKERQKRNETVDSFIFIHC